MCKNLINILLGFVPPIDGGWQQNFAGL